MIRLEDTTHGDVAPHYIMMSTGSGESPAEYRQRRRDTFCEVVDWHVKRQTFDAWIQDGSDELVPEYLERICREAIEDLKDRARFLPDHDELMAYAKERLGL